MNFYLWPIVVGTAGKVSQVSSKFGGSCSSSSCGSTPAHSPSGSVPSSPRRSFGTIQAKSGVAKSFEFGNISSPSIAPSTVRSTKTETTAVKTKYGDNKPSSDSQNVSSSKYATKTFESSSSSTSSSKTSTPYGMKTTKVDIPYGKDRHEKEGIMSLEIKTTGDRTIRVEVSCFQSIEPLFILLYSSGATLGNKSRCSRRFCPPTW